MSEVSSEERFILAIGRIEHALSRLERLPAPTPAEAQVPTDSALALRHDRLRATVQDAIARIDRLIDSGED